MSNPTAVPSYGSSIFGSMNQPSMAPPDRSSPSPSPSEQAPGPAAGPSVPIEHTRDFFELRRTLHRFVFPLTGAFLGWYALYVVLSAYARGFMGITVVGHINVALILGLLQFLSTFAIAWWYAWFAARRIDPIADRLRVGNQDQAAGR